MTNAPRDVWVVTDNNFEPPKVTVYLTHDDLRNHLDRWATAVMLGIDKQFDPTTFDWGNEGISDPEAYGARHVLLLLSLGDVPRAASFLNQGEPGVQIGSLGSD